MWYCQNESLIQFPIENNTKTIEIPKIKCAIPKRTTLETSKLRTCTTPRTTNITTVKFNPIR